MKVELWSGDKIVAYLETLPNKVMPVVEFKGRFYVRRGNGPEWHEVAGCLRVPEAWEIDALCIVEFGQFVRWKDWEGTVVAVDGDGKATGVLCTDGVVRVPEF